MIPPNLRQDWLRNTGLLLTLFVTLLAFLSWTLYRTVFGAGAPVIGGVEAVPMEPASVQLINSEPAPESAASGPAESDAPAPEEPVDGAESVFGGIAPIESERPRFAPQEAESTENFLIERIDGLGASFVRRGQWSRAEVLLAEGDGPDQADIDVILEAPDGGSRLALSAWNATERVPFELWVLSVAGGMRSIDGQYPFNAMIGGVPALIVGDPETPTSPVRYAAFLDRDSYFIRLAWSGGGPSADPYDFARALVTLNWDDSPGAAVDAAANAASDFDTVPAFDLPNGLYYPSDSLFAQQ